ncbi:hypothetical protein XELAEV_18035555mg [Xenopus laevis]|uniref:Uncharacterized protein n=1 Tax=Xenopus laevis TaxID=8355 RepID=A0A974HC72_XENLA|nr:hypothetical protein XELAEV_18035555mg [Xenopus laevis]
MLCVGKTIRPVNILHFFSNKHSACQLKWKVLEVFQKPINGGDWNNLLLKREAKWIRRLDSVLPKVINEQFSVCCFL